MLYSTQYIEQLDRTQIEIIWNNMMSMIDDNEKTLFTNELLELESEYNKELSTICLEE